MEIPNRDLHVFLAAQSDLLLASAAGVAWMQ
jgi:hypothetical protein